MASYYYLECENGVAGDMLVAALLDLGADAHRLMEVLQSLPLGGYEVRIDRVKKAGIDAMDFDVILDEDVEGHDHDMAYLHGGRGHNVYGSHRHEDWEGDPHDLPGHDGSGSERFHNLEGQSHGHCHGHNHDHFHGHRDDYSQDHRDDHSQNHSHGHSHGHQHTHRRLPEIYDIIDSGRMSERARELAKTIFYIVAQSEAKAHAMPVEDVHFHEVGAVDSIVDIVSIAVCIDDLGIGEFIVPYLCEGWGSVRCAHGVLPIPVPAVMAIAEAHRLPLKRIDVHGEFVTPTGAAAVAALRSDRTLPEVYTIKRMGIGAGKREYERPSLLRLYEIEAETGSASATASSEAMTETGVPKGGRIASAAPSEAMTETGVPKGGRTASAAPSEAMTETEVPKGGRSASAAPSEAMTETGAPKGDRSASTAPEKVDTEADEEFIWKLETNVDDITGEQLGYVMNLLFNAGARDVYFSPVQMKKGRPGIELVVICDEDHCRLMEELLFMETTTIGIRKQRMLRRVLPRHTAKVHTPVGDVRAKEVTLPDGTVRIYPEYDEVIALARQNEMTYHDAWCEVVRGLQQRF